MSSPVPVYPENVLIRFDTRNCGGPITAAVPPVYTLTQAVSYPGVNIGTFSITDRLIATFDPSISLTVPTNNTILESLVSQFTADFFAWGQKQFDLNLAGIAAVEPNGLIKTIEWKYNKNSCYTRISTQPDVFRLDRLTHQDPYLEVNCPSDDDNNTATPCIKWYGPPIVNQSSGQTSLDEFLVCFEDGRLVDTFLQTVTYDCGCTSETTCCVTTCSPCDIPKQNFILSWTNPIIGNGSTTLYFNGSTWASACVNGLMFILLCTDGQIELRVIYFTTGSCPTGIQQYCSNLQLSPYGMMLASYQCNSLVLIFDLTSSSCPVIVAAGYTQFIVTGQLINPPGLMCQTICVNCCLVPAPGYTVQIYSGSSMVASGVTGSNGCVYLTWTGTPGSYTVTIYGLDGFAGDSYTTTQNLECSGTTTIDVPGYYCCFQSTGNLIGTYVYTWKNVSSGQTGGPCTVSLLFQYGVPLPGNVFEAFIAFNQMCVTPVGTPIFGWYILIDGCTAALYDSFNNLVGFNNLDTTESNCNPVDFTVSLSGTGSIGTSSVEVVGTLTFTQ